MSKRRFAKLGLAGALSTLYGAAALHAYKNPIPGRPEKSPWRTAVVAAGMCSTVFTIAVL